MAWKSTCPHPRQVSVESRAWLSTERAPCLLAPHPSQRGTGVPTSERPPSSPCLFLGYEAGVGLSGLSTWFLQVTSTACTPYLVTCLQSCTLLPHRSHKLSWWLVQSVPGIVLALGSWSAEKS